jgi:hypothetical protein
MVILARNGNTWRLLDWTEYQTERANDGEYTEMERACFDRVVGFCVAEASAQAFCPGWGKA